MNYFVETRQLQQHVERTYTRHLHARGVTLPIIEAAILIALYEKDGQSARALASAVGRAATSFTPILDSLAEAGLIRRTPDPVDRRAVLIRLTDAGRALKQPITAAFDNAQRELDQTILDRLPMPDTARHVLAEHFPERFVDALAAS